MGRKTKKTTWRNLPIEDQQQQGTGSSVTISDSEESHITINSTRSATYHRQQKYYQGSSLTRTYQPNPRYQPYRSTCSYDPSGATIESKYHHHNNGYASDHGYERKRSAEGGSKYRGGAALGTDSGAGGGKITFNEDEYTRITTPRQDVLFKKGYLNRPRPTTVAPTTCTSEEPVGVPQDMQISPDAPLLMSPDTPFCYPAAGGYIARDGLYFFNGFEPYPVVVYNAAPPQYCYEFPPSLRSKRYSTDSMTESTSPHTEEHSGGDGEVPLFMPSPSSQSSATLIQTSTGIRRNPEPSIVTTNNSHPEQPNDPINSNPLEQRSKLKKKRRRRLSKPLNNPNPTESTTTSVSVSSCEDDDTSTDTEEQQPQEIVATAKESEDSPSTCPNSPQSGSSSSSSSSSSMTTTHSNSSITSKASSQLKPDAKEFIPRHYSVTTEFIPPPGQFHVIDQHGFIHQSGAFMSLPILMSPVGPPPHHFMMPPPPYNAAAAAAAAFNHHLSLAGQQFHDDEEIQIVEEVHQEATEADVTATVPDATKKEVLMIEDTPKPQQQQNNLSSEDIREIVSKLEETEKEQQDQVVKTKGRVNMHQFSQKSSPIRSKNNYRSSTNKTIVGLKTTPCSPQSQNQRKPYSNLFKPPQVVQNPSAKPVQKVKQAETSVKTNTVKLVAKESSGQHQAASTNQWISVSNRKKRRSNNVSNAQEDLPVEDLDSTLDIDNSSSVIKADLVLQEAVQANIEQTGDDGFEEYDVDKLVDVVVREIQEVTVVELENGLETSVEEEAELKVVQEIKIEATEEDLKTSDVIGRDVDEWKETKVSIKKPNNKNSKQIKRVMVTDNIPPILTKETPVKKVVDPPKKVEEPTKTQEKKDSASTPSKSSKKSNKKKSTTKASIESSPGSSKDRKDDTTSCSFDFLPSNSADKTNIEVSQELDLLIQRGMYSSLEEKIRSFNITASNDGFFKTIKYYGAEAHVTAESTLGNRDFNGILKDLKPALLNSKVDFGLSRINLPKDVSQTMAKQQTTGNNGYQDFLGLGPDLHEPDKGTSTIEQEQDSSREVSPTSEVDFPITRAVKEWMSKTREITPEVELLKSPTTILKQFKAVEASEIDDEVTLWTLSNQDSVESGPDLLDCWDTEEITSGDVKSDKDECLVEVELKMPIGDCEAGQGNRKDDVDDEKEVVEVYESRYGKNEEFVRVREEWEERSKTGNKSCNGSGKHPNRNVLPPTASLPYRAICCAIM